MKKILPLVAANLTFTAAVAPAAVIQFDAGAPLNVVDAGGFTGTSTVGSNPYTQAIIFFSISGLIPDPLSSPFSISNIFLKGDGITGSLTFGNVLIEGNSFYSTIAVNLDTSLSTINFSNSLVSFDLSDGNVINEGAEFSVFVQYRSAAPQFFNTLTSPDGPTFAAVPEPGTYSLLMLAGIGFAAHRRRLRAKTAD